jgi:hypothetical protein
MGSELHFSLSTPLVDDTGANDEQKPAESLLGAENWEK